MKESVERLASVVASLHLNAVVSGGKRQRLKYYYILADEIETRWLKQKI